MEVWKVIKYESNYEVSTLGNIRNKKTKHLKAFRFNVNKYLRVTLYPSGTTYAVHRLVADTFITNGSNKPVVNHMDLNKCNNNVSNLEWVTHKENTQHYFREGTPPDINGCKNPIAKFTEEDILLIRNSGTKTDTELAKDFNVSVSSITNIRTGERYKDVGGPLRTKYQKHNQVRGDTSGMSKLTSEIAYSIKYLESEKTVKELGIKYNIHTESARRIRNNQTWKHI